MNIEDIKNIKTRDEAEQFAIDWQSWQSGVSMRYSEMAEWEMQLAILASKFNLTEEFRENGII